jgi:hypothetical protein
VYKSWRICQDQVNGFLNNSYKGYETFEEAHQEYQSFLADHAMDARAVALLPLPTETGAPQVHSSRLPEFIIVGLIVLFFKIVFF